MKHNPLFLAATAVTMACTQQNIQAQFDQEESENEEGMRYLGHRTLYVVDELEFLKSAVFEIVNVSDALKEVFSRPLGLKERHAPKGMQSPRKRKKR